MEKPCGRREGIALKKEKKSTQKSCSLWQERDLEILGAGDGHAGLQETKQGLQGGARRGGAICTASP